MKPFVLATPDEIHAIFQRAMGCIEAYDPLTGPEPEVNVRFSQALEALRFCCVAAGELGDPSLLLLMTQALDILLQYDHYLDRHARTATHGLLRLLKGGMRADDLVQELAEHNDARVREAVACGLGTRHEKNLEVLELLAKDPIVKVRTPAIQSLRAHREVPWWTGKFTRDPTSWLSSQDEVLALKPVLEQLSSVLDQRRYHGGQLDKELVDLVSQLPDPLVVDLVENMHSVTDEHQRPFTELIALMVQRTGGIEALKRLCGLWSRDARVYGQIDDLAKSLLQLPHEGRTELCNELISYATSFSIGERQNICGAGSLVAKIAGKCWPVENDLNPLLDSVLQLEPLEAYASDWVVNGLKVALTAKGANVTSILDRCIEARLAGYPGPWAGICLDIDQVLSHLPAPALRAAAEQAILSDHDTNVTWGILQLLGPAHDPARDGTLSQLTARLFAQPRYRKIMLRSWSLRKMVMPLLRAEFRSGQLDFPETVTLFRVLEHFYSGFVRTRIRLEEQDISPKDAEAATEKERQRFEPFLGPAELRGPPTDTEWAMFRKARDEHPLDDPKLLSLCLDLVADGPWTPEDRGFLDRVVHHYHTANRHLGHDIAIVLRGKPDLGDMDLFDTLLNNADERSRHYIKDLRAAARKELGLVLDEDDQDEIDEDASRKDDDDKNDDDWGDDE